MVHTHHVGKDGASLAEFFSLLRLRKALIFLIVGLVLTTTLIVTAFLPKWYESTTAVLVKKPEGEVKLFQAQQSGYYDPYFLQDQFKIMQEANILLPVIEKLGLNEKLASPFGASGPLPADITLEYLRKKMLSIESPRGSSVIEITVSAQDPQLAADIANEIARVYSDDRINLATSSQREGLAQLRKELEAQDRTVTTQRDLVEKLRKDLNISGVDLNARYSDIDIETLRQMQNSLIALSVDAIGRKTRYERFKSIPTEDRVGLVNSELIQDPNIQNLLQAYLLADQNVTKLRPRLGEAHPDLISAVESRAKIREQLDAQLRGYENALEMAYKEADARVTELKSQLARPKLTRFCQPVIACGPSKKPRKNSTMRRAWLPRSRLRCASAKSIFRCRSARSKSSTKPNQPVVLRSRVGDLTCFSPPCLARCSVSVPPCCWSILIQVSAMSPRLKTASNGRFWA
jgi:uncharacterized protein involved in exopolysaccharide biosynthesis